MSASSSPAANSSSPTEERMALSDLLLLLADDQQQRITVAEIIGHFGPRAFGALLFIFAIPTLLPLPPGSTTVLGLPLLIIAPQLAFGVRRLKVPTVVGRRSVDGPALARACRRAAPWMARVEHLTTHRLTFMSGPLGQASMGLVCTLLAAVN